MGDDVPWVSKPVMADLRASAPQAALDDLRRAIGEAHDALEGDEHERSVELLRWAKSVAPGSWAVREAYGVALYRAGEYAKAHSELLTYRRLTNRQDQNHLLADCARAMDRSVKVDEYVEAMRSAPVPPDRLAEAVIVQAGVRADRGDLRGALGVLKSSGLEADRLVPWHPRMWYAAGDLAQRMGDVEAARGYFAAIIAVGDDELDAQARLDELGADM